MIKMRGKPYCIEVKLSDDQKTILRLMNENIPLDEKTQKLCEFRDGCHREKNYSYDMIINEGVEFLKSEASSVETRDS